VKMTKIIELIRNKQEAHETFFSFEYFPPKTDQGVINLEEKQLHMVTMKPLFCDVTWGAGGSTSDLTLKIAKNMHSKIGMTTMMHVTCTNMPVSKIEVALQECKAAGIRNIVALRGDPPAGEGQFKQVEGGFACALDLVKYIRRQHGDYFGICVAGYPEAHPEKIVSDAEQMRANYLSDIDYLKQKVDAGADFVITQLFYDADGHIQFVKDCRARGITVPILPGVMPIGNYAGFKRMTTFCKTRIPQHIADVVEALKDNEEALKLYGISLWTVLCQRLLDNGAPGLHVYTLNQDKVTIAILRHCGLIAAAPAAAPATEPTSNGTH